MPAKSKIDALEARVNELHRQRFKPPLMRWIEEQNTEKLTILRTRLEAGQDIVTAMKGLTDD